MIFNTYFLENFVKLARSLLTTAQQTSKAFDSFYFLYYQPGPCVTIEHQVNPCLNEKSPKFYPQLRSDIHH